MMQRLYGFVRAHSCAVFALAAVVAAGEAAFIGWQRSVQARLLEEIAGQELLPPSVMVTATPVERGPFRWRDRLRITVASSLFSGDPSAAPFSLEADVVAQFGPFGLTGDVYPLNTTVSTAGLLMRLAGTHPRLALRYRWAVLRRELQMVATAQPFDIQLDADEPGVGPMSWHLSASKPVAWRLRVGRDAVLHGDLSAPELTGGLTDPAANMYRFEVSSARLKTVSRWKSGAGGAREQGGSAPTPLSVGHVHAEASAGDGWYLGEGRFTAERFAMDAGDWRGALTLRLDRVSASAEQTENVRESELEGAYAIGAKRLEAAIDSPRSGIERRLAGRNLRLRLTADSVPSELIANSIDEYRTGRILERAAPLALTIEELSLAPARPGEAATHLEAGLRAEKVGRAAKAQDPGRPADPCPGCRRALEGVRIDWRLAADVSAPVLDMVETILHGARADTRGGSLASLMERRETASGPVWSVRLSGSAGGSAAPAE